MTSAFAGSDLTMAALTQEPTESAVAAAESVSLQKCACTTLRRPKSCAVFKKTMSTTPM